MTAVSVTSPTKHSNPAGPTVQLDNDNIGLPLGSVDNVKSVWLTILLT